MTGTRHDAKAEFEAWLSTYASAIYSGKPEAVAATILPQGWFRDALTFNWDTRAARGHEKIISYFSENISKAKVADIELDDNPHLQPTFATMPMPCLEGAFRYQTPIAWGKGFARLLKDSQGQWKAHVVGMTAADIKGHEELRGTPPGYNAELQDRFWSDVYEEQKVKNETDPYVLVVGAGQSGLMATARFRQMRIPTLLIERNDRVGDNWRKRYDSLVLHTSYTHHQFLYQPFPTNWPVVTPRDLLANWMETYAITQNLTVWTTTVIHNKPAYDPKTRRWTVILNRNGKLVELHPAHIVMCTGTLGEPYIPTLPGQEGFLGPIVHSSQYRNALPYRGKRIVVIGSGQSANDICQELSTTGGAASVTMVQRSSSCVVTNSEIINRTLTIFRGDLPAEISDFKNGSAPLGYTKELLIMGLPGRLERNKDLHDTLRKAGIALNDGPDGAGTSILAYEGFTGYWQDKGSAALMASGAIKVKQGVSLVAYTPNSAVFSDESQLPADAVILATGYTPIRDTTRRIFGSQVTDSLKEIYGLDEEGELKGSYRPSGHPGLWFATADFFAARYWSKYLALQIKARQIGYIKD